MLETRFNFTVSAFLPPINLTCYFNTTIYTVTAGQLAKSCHLNLLELFLNTVWGLSSVLKKEKKTTRTGLFLLLSNCISAKLYFVRISPCTTLGTRGFFLCATRSSVCHRPTCLQLKLWEKTSGAKLLDLPCSMDLDLVSSLSIKSVLSS